MRRWAFLLLLLLLAACGAGKNEQAKQEDDTYLILSRANFRIARVHVVGRAHNHRLLWVTVKGDNQLMTTAWTRLKRKAKVEGLSAQYVNPTVDVTRRWSIWPLYWQDHYTVSADVITFDPQTR